jgi:hypothetical protein
METADPATKAEIRHSMAQAAETMAQVLERTVAKLVEAAYDLDGAAGVERLKRDLPDRQDWGRPIDRKGNERKGPFRIRRRQLLEAPVTAATDSLARLTVSASTPLLALRHSSIHLH